MTGMPDYLVTDPDRETGPLRGSALVIGGAVREVVVHVVGVPAPKGSKRALGRRASGSVILVESAGERLTAWSAAVCRQVQARGIVQMAGPVEVHTEYVMPRPARPTFEVPAVKPDGDKLDRALWDALTRSGLIEDDARVVTWSGRKRYCEPGEQTGAWITVRTVLS